MSDFKPLSPEDLFQLPADQIKKINALLVAHRKILTSTACIPWEELADVLGVESRMVPTKHVTWALSQTYGRQGWNVQIYQKGCHPCETYEIVFIRTE